MSGPLAEPHADRAAATEIVAALSAIEDPGLRRAAVLDRLRRLDPGRAAAFLNGLLLLAADRQTTAVGLLPVASGPSALAEALGERRVEGIRAAARESGRTAVVRLLLERPPRRGSADDEAPARGATSQLPLGWRTQLGRIGSRDVMDRLLLDRDPRVIASLLRNRRCTEREVVRVAAHRPSSAAVLSVVFRHPKWIQRYRVKRALVLNPYALPAEVVALLPALVIQDLELVARDETLHPEVVRAAAALLAARRGEPPPPAEPDTPAPEVRPDAPLDDEPGGIIDTPPELRAAVEEALREVEAAESLAGTAERATAEDGPAPPPEAARGDGGRPPGPDATRSGR